jgi:DNA modification methylase
LAAVPYWSDGTVTLHLGDCLDVLAAMKPESADAVVTDPPYELTSGKKGGTGERSLNLNSPAGRSRIGTGGGFMGLSWDATGVPMNPALWREVLRVLKPGGYLLAFGGTRTWHRLACAIEDAGFEIRDSISWLYGQGFAKSLDVSKAIDKAAGADREVVGEKTSPDGVPYSARHGERSGRTGRGIMDSDAIVAVTRANELKTAPATEDAARWSGWGTALKPAHEPIVVARKPLAGTVAANVLEYGTGALNIDGCRVGITAADLAALAVKDGNVTGLDDGRAVFGAGARRPHGNPDGRWPPNVLLTHTADCEPAGARQVRGGDGSTNGRTGGSEVFGAQSHRRPRSDFNYAAADGTETVQAWECAPGCPVAELDRQSGVLASGANPARRGTDKFRDAYGEFTGQQECTVHRGADTGGASRFFPAFRYQAKAPASERPRLGDGTAWPTVKPLELMRWLVRLVTPPGGLVVDPFAGTGTTGQACALEGFTCLLIERDPLAAELAVRRLSRPVQAELL